MLYKNGYGHLPNQSTIHYGYGTKYNDKCQPLFLFQRNGHIGIFSCRECPVGLDYSAITVLHAVISPGIAFIISHCRVCVRSDSECSFTILRKTASGLVADRFVWIIKMV